MTGVPAGVVDGASDAGAVHWSDGALAAALLAVDPAGLGGAVVHAFPGPVRERWLREFRHLCPGNQRFLPHQDDASLLGGLDVAATLQAGRPRLHHGVLSASDGGALVVPMAERLSARQAAHIGAALDTGRVVIERDGFARTAPARLGVVLLDESLDPEDACPGILLERCAFRIDLSRVALADLKAVPYGPDAVAAARRRLDTVAVPDAALEALCASAERLGLGSLRLPTLALRAARPRCSAPRRSVRPRRPWPCAWCSDRGRRLRPLRRRLRRTKTKVRMESPSSRTNSLPPMPSIRTISPRFWSRRPSTRRACR